MARAVKQEEGKRPGKGYAEKGLCQKCKFAVASDSDSSGGHRVANSASHPAASPAWDVLGRTVGLLESLPRVHAWSTTPSSRHSELLARFSGVMCLEHSQRYPAAWFSPPAL